jgi:hypothetical protein
VINEYMQPPVDENSILFLKKDIRCLVMFILMVNN